METIQRGYYVEMHYDMRTLDGFELGSTRDSNPLAFIPGMMETDPPGLGHRILGQSLDFSGSIVLEPQDAFGDALPIEQSVGVVDRSDFPPDFPLEPGMIFEVAVEGRGYVPGMILDIQGDEVRLKYGHPLAGQTIIFEVEIVEARMATEEDIEILKERYAAPQA